MSQHWAARHGGTCPAKPQGSGTAENHVRHGRERQRAWNRRARKPRRALAGLPERSGGAPAGRRHGEGPPLLTSDHRQRKAAAILRDADTLHPLTRDHSGPMWSGCRTDRAGNVSGAVPCRHRWQRPAERRHRAGERLILLEAQAQRDEAAEPSRACRRWQGRRSGGERAVPGFCELASSRGPRAVRVSRSDRGSTLDTGERSERCRAGADEQELTTRTQQRTRCGASGQ